MCNRNDQWFQRLNRAITMSRDTARGEICGALGRLIKGVSNYQNSNANVEKNAQRRYCAGPRLDRTRDASLDHQRCHDATQQALYDDMAP